MNGSQSARHDHGDQNSHQQYVDPSFMLTQIGFRKNEINEMNGSEEAERNNLTANENTQLGTERSEDN